jgi:SAM-dependent methyltransferase
MRGVVARGIHPAAARLTLGRFGSGVTSAALAPDDRTHIAYGSAFYAFQQPGSAASAAQVVPVLADLVRPRSVVDIGCGTGSWLAAFQQVGVGDVLGIDGDYVSRSELLIPQEQFLPVDLTRPFRVPRPFDLAVSLEVAEHLPESAAAAFIASLADAAPAVLFSAAVPFQGGWNHVNEQWPDYWAEHFAVHGLLPLDCLRATFWTDSRVRWWYAQNMVLYLRRDHPLWGRYQPTSPLPRLVHPENYLRRVEQIRDAERERTARETVRRIAADVIHLPRRTLRAWRRRATSG